MKKEEFSGPLFIVGMPRSGTKLLRDLMNRHPLISIPDVESHFIPHMVKIFGTELSLKNETSKLKFINTFRQSTFYVNNVKKGRTISDEYFLRHGDFSSWNSIFRFISVYFSKKIQSHELIWGDKTPGYLKHVPLLKTIFPDARFIHIIRDPRDYCVSMRNIWNKNIFRAAARWTHSINKSSKYAPALGQDYMEMHYEHLISNTEQTMKRISGFCEIDFTVEMISPGKASENYGDAKGMTEILMDNSNKFLSSLSSNELCRIESICCKTMIQKGYECVNKVDQIQLSGLENAWFKIQDMINILRFHIREKGLFKGVSYFIKLQNNNLKAIENY